MIEAPIKVLLVGFIYALVGVRVFLANRAQV